MRGCLPDSVEVAELERSFEARLTWMEEIKLILWSGGRASKRALMTALADLVASETASNSLCGNGTGTGAENRGGVGMLTGLVDCGTEDFVTGSVLGRGAAVLASERLVELVAPFLALLLVDLSGVEAVFVGCDAVVFIPDCWLEGGLGGR